MEAGEAESLLRKKCPVTECQIKRTQSISASVDIFNGSLANNVNNHHSHSQSEDQVKSF